MSKLDRTLEFKESIKSNIISSFPPKKTKNLFPKPPQDTWTKQAEQVVNIFYPLFYLFLFFP